MTDGRRILHATAEVARIFSVLLLLPIPVAFAYEPWDLNLAGLMVPYNAAVFLASALLMALYWVPVNAATQQVASQDLQDKEAYLVVGLGWLMLTAFAMVPFILSRTFDHPVDAWFETMSGLTTTGATVMAGVLEDVPRSIMLWRAMLQYIGGMGIIVLSVAILARLTHGGVQLLQAETPGPSLTRLQPKLAQTAKTLWAVYAVFSGLLLVILTALFVQAGMTWADALYDAIIHTFTTMSTGGFSNHSASIAYYDSWIVEAVLIGFMLVAGSNFTLHYYALHGDWRRLWRDSEWRFFMIMFLSVTALTTGFLWRMAGDALGGLRGAAFTVASIGTSTGYVTVDFNEWPDTVRMLLIVMMLTGATAGSTSGGMKVVRIMLLMKVVRREIRTLLHPRAIIPVRLAGKVLKEETILTAMAFFFSFITIWLIGAGLIITIEPGVGAFDGAVIAASAIGNTGPAMGFVGPTESYAVLLPSSKMIMSILMWVGRLEVFTAIVLLSPAAWRN